MKWMYALKGKVKVASYLALLSFIIILFNLLMKSNVSELEQSVESMYKDRLLAGATISSIIEITYQNHLQLEEHIHTNSTEIYDWLEQDIKGNNVQADSLLNSFKQTFLVEEEKKALDVFVENNKAYKLFQKELLVLSRRGEKKASYERYHKEGNRLFTGALLPAQRLSGIQTAVGKQIYNNSLSRVRDATVLSTLEAGLVVVILCLIYGLLMVSNSLVNTQQKYWLN